MAEGATSLTVTSNVVMVTASTDSARSNSYSALAPIRIHIAASVVWVRKLHADFLVGILVLVADCEARVDKAGDGRHAGGARVVRPASVRLLLGRVGFIDEGCVRVGGIGLVDGAGNLLLEYVCLG
jgi:hypothetical protein